MKSPPFFPEKGRKINLRPFSRKKGGFFISAWAEGGGRRAEGGFYRRPHLGSIQIGPLM